MSSLNAEIRTAIALNHIDHARDLLRRALRDSPDAETYYLASQVAVSEQQKREFLSKALEIDPFYQDAHLAMERLKVLSRSEPEPSEAFRSEFAPIYQPKVKTGALSYALAGLGERLLAQLIDSFILLVLSSLVIALYLTFGIGEGDFEELLQDGVVISLLQIATSALYYIYFLTRHNGQTPGKAALGIRIVKLNGAQLTAWDAILRNIIGYYLSGLFFVLGYLWALWDERRQGWHDKLAGTVVIKAR